MSNETTKTTYKQINAAGATKKDIRDIKTGEKLLIKCRDKEDVRRCKRLATLCREPGWVFATSFHPIAMLLVVWRAKPGENLKPGRTKCKLTADMCRALQPGERLAVHYEEDHEISGLTSIVYRTRKEFGCNISRMVSKATRTFYVIRRLDD